MTNDSPPAWPFDVPRNTVAATTRSIMDRGASVLIIQHLAEGEGWTFLDGEPFDLAEALLVSIGRIYDLDSSVGEVADLPEGWAASREHSGAPWKRDPDDV